MAHEYFADDDDENTGDKNDRLLMNMCSLSLSLTSTINRCGIRVDTYRQPLHCVWALQVDNEDDDDSTVIVTIIHKWTKRTQTTGMQQKREIIWKGIKIEEGNERYSVLYLQVFTPSISI